jgi:hypothetical protein
MKYLMALIFLILLFLTCKIPETRYLFPIMERNRTGFIYSDGEIAIAPRFRVANPFSEGYSAARIDGKYGYIDASGNWAIPPKYDFATDFKEGYAVVFEGKLPQFIDKNGIALFPAHYKNLEPFCSGLSIVETCSRKTGVVDISGKLVIDTAFNWCRQETPAMFWVQTFLNENKETQEGVFNHLGQDIIPLGAYQSIKYLSEGIFTAEKSDSTVDAMGNPNTITFLLDSTGKVLMEREDVKGDFFSTEAFCKGILPVSFYNIWPLEEDWSFSSDRIYPGYVNRNGKPLLKDTLMENATPFSEDRAFVQYKGENYTLIDTAFNQVGETTFKKIEMQWLGYPVFADFPFVYGFAFVIPDSNNHFGMIDRSGNWIINPVFDNVYGITEGRIIFSVNAPTKEIEYRRLYGISDLKGRIVLDPILEEYDKNGFNHGMLQAVVDGCLAWVNKNGTIVWKEKKEKFVEDANLDFMQRGFFCVSSETYLMEGGGHWESFNTPKPITHDLTFPAGILSVNVMEDQIVAMNARWNAYKVYISNSSEVSIGFNASDSRLYMKVQAKTPEGDWADIMYLPRSFCGNSLHVVTLPPGEYWDLEVPRYQGAFKTKLRIELSQKDTEFFFNKDSNRIFYSNEFEGSINLSQFWREEGHSPGSFMDPYFN